MIDIPDEARRTELGSRESNGIIVKLFWRRSTNLVTVAVTDSANDDSFELVVDKHESALDVFHQTFARAAARGLEYRRRGPETEVVIDAARFPRLNPRA